MKRVTIWTLLSPRVTSWLIRTNGSCALVADIDKPGVVLLACVTHAWDVLMPGMTGGFMANSSDWEDIHGTYACLGRFLWVTVMPKKILMVTCHVWEGFMAGNHPEENIYG